MSDLSVTVVYAREGAADVRVVRLPAGATVQAAIARSGLLAAHGEINLDLHKVGVYGELARLTDLLADGDRVEIYRPAAGTKRDLRRRAQREDKKERVSDVEE